MAAADDFNVLRQFSEWMGLEAEETEKFISTMMTRRGHKPVTNWADGDGGKQKNNEPDNVFGIRTSKGGNSGQNWQYGS